jgi:YidC/Oxa1 family membrane protein insertase
VTDNRNFLLAIILSILIIAGFQYLYKEVFPRPAAQPGQETTATEAPKPAAPQAGSGREAAPALPAEPGSAGGARSQTGPQASAPGVPAGATRAQVLASSPRVQINTPSLHGSISLVGGRLDDITLVKFHETLDRGSAEIVLFSPPGAADAYYAQGGWVAPAGGVTLPAADTLWTADHDTLTPAQPVTLTWKSPGGVTFRRIFAIDENYLITVTQQVSNASDAPLTLSPYSLITRQGTPPVSGFYILHEGPLGVFNDTLEEIDYEDLQKAGTITQRSQGGWIGMTDKYWLSALIPDQKQSTNMRFFFERYNDKDHYQVDVVDPQVTIAPGESAETQSRIFVGAKEVRILDDYSEKYGISRFDLAIDFGWFYFLTKPLFYFLIYLKELTGNLGVAILLLTVTIKLLFFPLANKSYRSMSQMRKLQPEVAKLKERFSDDRVRFNQEVMALYKQEKVNPAAGCLPVIIQIPVFFALYKVLFVTIEMRHAPFFGWIKDLSAPDPTSIWNLFGLLPWDPSLLVPAMLNIGAWPLFMGVTMWMQQRLNPQPTDPVQAKVFMFLPIMFTFLLAHFPAGLVIYWAWNNVLSILQQWVIMKRMGVKA